MKTYTEEEVKSMLVSVFLYAGSNNNQGTKSIYGNTYGEQAQTVIDCNNAVIGTNKSMISVVSQFNSGLHAPIPSKEVEPLVKP